MPLILNQIEFRNPTTGVWENSLRNNAGDFMDILFQFSSAVRLTSIDNPLSFDPTIQEVTSSSVSWLEEGFRVTDTILVRLYTQNQATGSWSVTSTVYSSITYVDDTKMNFNSLPFFYSLSGDPQIMVFLAVGQAGSTISRPRADITLNINMCLNSQTGNQGSLIDGESTRIYFDNVHNLSVNQLEVGTKVGNQSGQFLNSAFITRKSNDADGFLTYTMRVTMVQMGVYNQEWFALDDCLKFFCKLQQASLPLETSGLAELVIDQEANTGWFNTANNISIPELPSEIVSGITTEVDYAQPSTHEFTFKCADINTAGFGACYIPTDDAYYRNVVYSQMSLSMILKTTPLAVGLPQAPTEQNPDGADYTIQINSITSVGQDHTVNFTFTPNLQFPNFMENRESGDRLFYIWVRSMNKNLLVYADQLTKVLPIGGPISMVNDYGFFDHAENIDTTNENKIGFVCDTEDDVGYFGKFALERNGDYAGLRVKVQAYNSATDEDFELRDTYISFAGVQTSNLGELLLNETIPLENTLPTTSVKREGKLINLNTAGSGQNEYLVSIYYPFLLNWKYWLPLLQASVDFYPTQNNNWEQYDNVANWEIRLRLELEKDGLVFFHNNTIAVNPYDANDSIQSVITMIRDIDGTIVDVIPDGELMRIVSTHTRTDGSNWDPTFTWGMITIEPKEAEQRFICSSIVDYDNNAMNPLTPIAGLTINITYPQGNVARMECFFDSAKINIINGVKITGKICEGCLALETENKITTDGTDKITTNDINKIKA